MQYIHLLHWIAPGLEGIKASLPKLSFYVDSFIEKQFIESPLASNTMSQKKLHTLEWQYKSTTSYVVGICHGIPWTLWQFTVRRFSAPQFGKHCVRDSMQILRPKCNRRRLLPICFCFQLQLLDIQSAKSPIATRNAYGDLIYQNSN